MRVILIQNTEGDPSLALTRYLVETSRALANTEGISGVTVITSSPTLVINGVETHSVGGSPYSIRGNLLFMFLSTILVLRLRQRFQIVHALYPSTSLLPAFIYKIMYGAKLVYELRSPWVEMGLQKRYSKNSAILTRLFAYSLEAMSNFLADGYIFISEGLYQYYTNSFLSKELPVTIFPSATTLLDKDQVRLKDFSIDNAKLIHLGTLETAREISQLILNFDHLLTNYPDIKLTFIGGGDDERNLLNLTEQLSLQNNVDFTGRISPQEVHQLLPKFDIGITHLPPKQLFRYSSPIKNYEYLSHGLLLLVSDIEPNNEFVRAGFGHNYTYNSPDSFVKAYEQLPQLNTTKQDILEYLNLHTYDANAKKITDLYSQILT